MSKKVLLLLFIILFLLYWYYLSPHITFENLKLYRTELKNLVTGHPFISALLYIIIYTIGIALALPVAIVLTLAGGFLFGIVLGSAYAVTGATLGATISFLGTRFLFGDYFQRKFKDRLNRFNQNIREKGAYYLLSLRLTAVIPFFLVNILAGLTTIPLKTFVTTTLFGIIPGSLVFTYAGQKLGTIESMKDILSPSVMIAFLFLGVLALLPTLFKKRDQKQGL